jgi:hypothetical protein
VFATREEPGDRVPRGELVAWIALVACVMAAVAAFHLRGLSGSFLSDDFGALFHLHRESEAGTLGRWLAERFVAPQPGMSAAYRPIGFASFALDWKLYGAGATGWHLTSLFLHLANSLLVGVVLARWLRGANGATAAAALAAALFAVFPFVGELTTWVAARFDLLAATFGLLFLATFDGVPASLPRHALRIGLLYAALLSKESAAPLPLVAFLVDLALCRDGDRDRRARWRFAIRDVAPLALAFVAYLGWRYTLFGHAFKVYPQSGLPGGLPEYADRLAMIGTMVARQAEGAIAHWPLVAAALAMAVVGAGIIGRRTSGPAATSLAAACTVAAIGYLLAPALSLPAIEAGGTGARNYYLGWAMASMALGCIAAASLGARVAVGALVAWLLVGQAANLEQWQFASRQMKAVTGAIPALAATVPADGYALLILPDSIGPALFARNSQSVLVARPVQSKDYVDRVVAMTEADFANWRSHFRDDTIARLKRAPFDPAHFSGVYCWNPRQGAFVRVGRAGAVTDVDLWERDVRAGVAGAGCLRGTVADAPDATIPPFNKQGSAVPVSSRSKRAA